MNEKNKLKTEGFEPAFCAVGPASIITEFSIAWHTHSHFLFQDSKMFARLVFQLLIYPLTICSGHFWPYKPPNVNGKLFICSWRKLSHVCCGSLYFVWFPQWLCQCPVRYVLSARFNLETLNFGAFWLRHTPQASNIYCYKYGNLSPGIR